MKLNEKIYYYRKRAKLSQEELAAQVGVSRQAVSKWELGDATPELDKLAALAKAFGVTADELLSEGEPEADGEKREERQTQEFSYQKERGRAAWGFLERMAHRYGWLAGVYVALSGLGTALVGILARFAFSRMFAITVNDVMGELGGMLSDGWEVTVPSGWDGMFPGEIGGMTAGITRVGEVFVAIATAILVAGVIVTVAGVVLAVYLYNSGRKKD